MTPPKARKLETLRSDECIRLLEEYPSPQEHVGIFSRKAAVFRTSA
jgi:hypothetical protein